MEEKEKNIVKQIEIVNNMLDTICKELNEINTIDEYDIELNEFNDIWCDGTKHKKYKILVTAKRSLEKVGD